MDREQLYRVLRSASRLVLLAEVTRVVSMALGILLVAALLALAIDAVLALAAWGLIAVDVAILGLLASAVAYVAWQVYRHWFDPRRSARLLEERLNIRDSRLINAVDLSSARASATSGELLERSIDEGAALAATISPRAAVTLRPMARAVGIAAVALLFVLVSYVSAPRVFGRVIPRYLDPLGDHPPYTLVNFEIQVAPEQVYRGRPASITARLSGPDLPDRANVVLLEPQGPRQLPMLRAGDGSFVLRIDKAEASREFYIDTPKGRSQKATIEVLDIPLIERASIAYHFPAYTTWPSTSSPLDTRGIRALQGTEVELTVQSNLPLRSATLELKPDGKAEAAAELVHVTLYPSPTDPTVVAGSFELAFSGRYSLTLLSANGATSEEPLTGPLSASPDRVPAVQIVQPEPVLLAVEDWVVNVRIDATDDVAVERLEMASSINGWGPTPAKIATEQRGPGTMRGTYAFDLAALGAQPGDIISYYATAYDNHPSGEHVAETKTHVIQVISTEDYLDYARQEYRMEEISAELAKFRQEISGLKAKREKVLEKLEGLRKKAKNKEPLSEDEQRQLEQLEKELEEFARQAEQLAERLKERTEQAELYDFEKPYNEALRKLARQLEKQADNAATAAGKAKSLRKDPTGEMTPEDFAAAAERFAEEKEPFDEASEQDLESTEDDLHRIGKADELLAQAERIQNVIEAQRQLADRLGQFADKESLTPEEQKIADRLAKEQELLQQELEDAARRLEKAADEAEETLPKMCAGARGICKAIKDLEIGQEQQTAARECRGGAGQKAHESAQSAAEKLESLLSDAPPPGEEQAGDDLDGCLKMTKGGMKQSMRQLAQGRKVPGLSGKRGKGGGTGGSQSRVTVAGPRLPTTGQSNAKEGRHGGTGNGLAASENDEPDSDAAETLNPGEGDANRGGGRNMHGVPVGYRDQAEAYFKRLAEGK